MTLKKKFVALKKNYQSISSSNQELENQNEYLRCQLGEVLKQKKVVASPLVLFVGMKVKKAANPRILQVRRSFPEDQEENEGLQATLMTSELRFLNSKASLSLMSF